MASPGIEAARATERGWAAGLSEPDDLSTAPKRDRVAAAGAVPTVDGPSLVVEALPEKGLPGCKLPQGFEYRGYDGSVMLVVEAENKDVEPGEPKKLFTCSKIEFQYRMRDWTGDGWGKLVRVTQPDGTTKDVFVHDRLLGEPRDLTAVLRDKGVELATGRGALDRLIDLFTRAKPPLARHTDKTGWIGDDFGAFMLPDGIVGDQLAEAVLYTGTVAAGGSKGTLADWSANLAGPLEGNSRVALAFGTMFAGPLLRPLGMQGSIVNVYGASTSGKSTICYLANSIWGPRKSAGSWRATDNASESNLLARNDRTYFMDELGQGKGLAVGETVYMVTNGQGKARAGQTGEARAVKQFTVELLSNGEVPFATKIADDRSGKRQTAGQAVRALDVPADAGKGHRAFDVIPDGFTDAAWVDAVKAMPDLYYGAAGPAFVAWLVETKATAFDKARQYVNDFVKAVSKKWPAADPQVLRVAGNFAVVYAALRLAIDAGIVPWAPKSAGGVMVCFGDWYKDRGHVGSHEAAGALDAIDGFVVAHGARFEDVKHKPFNPIRDRAGFADSLPDGGRVYYITAAAFAEACGGAEPRLAAKQLDAAKRLATKDSGQLTTKRTFADAGRQRYYAIRMGADDAGQGV